MGLVCCALLLALLHRSLTPSIPIVSFPVGKGTGIVMPLRHHHCLRYVRVMSACQATSMNHRLMLDVDMLNFNPQKLQKYSEQGEETVFDEAPRVCNRNRSTFAIMSMDHGFDVCGSSRKSKGLEPY